MKQLQSLSRRVLALALAASLTGCASSTIIRTNPPGATLYVDKQRICVTPCRYTDRRISFSKVKLQLKKESYKPFEATITRDSSINFGAIFFGIMMIAPAFWVMGYDEQYVYDLEPLSDVDALDWEEEVKPGDDEDTGDLY